MFRRAKSQVRAALASSIAILWLASPVWAQTTTDALYLVYDASKNAAKVVDKNTGLAEAVALTKALGSPPSLDCQQSKWAAAISDLKATFDEVVRCDTGEKYALIPTFENAYPVGAKLLRPLPRPGGGTDDPGPSLKP